MVSDKSPLLLLFLQHATGQQIHKTITHTHTATKHTNIHTPYVLSPLTSAPTTIEQAASALSRPGPSLRRPPEQTHRQTLPPATLHHRRTVQKSQSVGEDREEDCGVGGEGDGVGGEGDGGGRGERGEREGRGVVN